MSKLVALPAPIVPMPAGATIDVAELMLLDGYQTLPICLLRISTTNRKRFNLDALQQLAANIKEVGILQPILVRPVKPTEEHPQPFEVVAGERRYRSAVIAPLDEAPVIVRRLSDAQAAEIQLLENIQREDPHPLEEAEGYQLLMQNHGYDADQLAERVKKSRAYIYGRLKLCALTLDVREVFLDGDISASTALLIARIPVPELQKKALQEIVKPHGRDDPMSYRAAAAHIANRYTLDLADAPFNIKDGKLLAAAGNCVKCPKRTGNQPEIYPDAKSADVCTDPDCFSEKKAAQYLHIIVQANKRGIPVLEGDEAWKLSSNTWSNSSEFVLTSNHLSSFERVTPATGMSGRVRNHLTADELPSPVKYLKDSDGEVQPVYSRADVQAALEKKGSCETLEQREARQAVADADPAMAQQLSKQQQAAAASRALHLDRLQRAETMTLVRTTLYRKLRADAMQGGMSLPMFRELAKALIHERPLPHDLLPDLYPFDRNDDAACAFIDNADGPTTMLIIMDLIVGESLSVEHYSVDDEPDMAFVAVEAMAKIEGIDVTPADLAVAAIDVQKLKNFDDVYQVIAADIEYLTEVARHIIDKAPHHTGNVEAAANKLGYFYNNGWTKAEDAAGVDQVQDDATAQLATDDACSADQMPVDHQHASAQRPKLQLKSKSKTQATTDGPVIKIKKNRTTLLQPNDDLPTDMEYPV